MLCVLKIDEGVLTTLGTQILFKIRTLTALFMKMTQASWTMRSGFLYNEEWKRNFKLPRRTIFLIKQGLNLVYFK